MTIQVRPGASARSSTRWWSARPPGGRPQPEQQRRHRQPFVPAPTSSWRRRSIERPCSWASKVVFTVGIENFGPDPAQAVAVGDLLPAGLTFVSATPASGHTTRPPACGRWATCSRCSSRGTWWPNRPPCSSSRRTGYRRHVHQRRPPTAPLVPPRPGPDQQRSERGPVTVSLVPADVSVTKTVSPSQVAVGRPVTFTITVTNAGPGPRRTSSSPTPCRWLDADVVLRPVVLDHRPRHLVSPRHDDVAAAPHITVTATATVGGTYTNVASSPRAPPTRTLTTGYRRRLGPSSTQYLRQRRHPTPLRRARCRLPAPAVPISTSGSPACSCSPALPRSWSPAGGG